MRGVIRHVFENLVLAFIQGKSPVMARHSIRFYRLPASG